MDVLQADPLSAADQQALEHFRPVIDQMTPAGRRKLLALVALRCLPGGGGDLSLTGDDGEVFAHLSSVPRPGADLTPGDLAAIERALTDPRRSRPWREVLAQLDAEDDRE
jgi:hypothetical protein